MTGAALELFEIDDASRIVALTVEVRPDQVRFVADDAAVAHTILAKCVAPPDGSVWTPYVAVDADGAVGVVAVVTRGDEARLRHMAVDHRRQGVGLGKQMLDAVVAMIDRRWPTCRSIVVTAHPENAIALALYESAGFVRTGEFTGVEPVLRLDLTARRRSW